MTTSLMKRRELEVRDGRSEALAIAWRRALHPQSHGEQREVLRRNETPARDAWNPNLGAVHWRESVRSIQTAAMRPERSRKLFTIPSQPLTLLDRSRAESYIRFAPRGGPRRAQPSHAVQPLFNSVRHRERRAPPE